MLFFIGYECNNILIDKKPNNIIIDQKHGDIFF